jgi:hypothetical protein
MSIEAMKLALEALEKNYVLINGTERFLGLDQIKDTYYAGCFDVDGINKQTNDAITTLRTAIEQAEKQQPVALPCCSYTDASAIKWNPLNGVVQCHNCGQTYTPPAAQEPVAYKWKGELFTPGEIEMLDVTDAVPLYQHPEPVECMCGICKLGKREWVGLTDADIDNLELPPSGTATVRDFVRLIETKLKERNHG